MKIAVLLVGLVVSVSSVQAQETARTTSVLPDGMQIISGSWRKAATGKIDIPFGATFSSLPIVVVSSIYPAHVGTETIVEVKPDRFTVTSPYAADNYFVNWFAMGKK
jgi:hypothetical protein